MKSGDTFMLEDEDGADEHLHVVLTDPSLAGEIITACICTQRRWSETLVCLKPGDHPFIKWDSVVPYRFAAIRRCIDIEGAFARGTARPKEPASVELVKKMIAGLIESDFTPPGIRAYYLAISKVEGS